MKLEEGRSYKRCNGKPFLFGVEVGTYVGRSSGEPWPMFDLGEGKSCMINTVDDDFILHDPTEKTEDNHG